MKILELAGESWPVDTSTCCGYASRVLERTRHTIMVSQRNAMRALAMLSAVAAISIVSAAKSEMKRRSTELPHATHLLQPVRSLGSGGCTVVPNVDRHLLRNGMDVSLRPLLGWTISPGCGPGAQTGALQERSSLLFFRTACSCGSTAVGDAHGSPDALL